MEWKHCPISKGGQLQCRRKNKEYDDEYHRGKWILTGPNEENHLIKMSWTRIKRHKMITHNNSPYDKSKQDYFMNR